jgi:diguanylate cyclase (GGDEF)-like protein
VEKLLKTSVIDSDVYFEDSPRIKGYSATMDVVVAYEYGEFLSSYGDFPTKQLVPWTGNKHGSHTLIFFPVHFQNLCFGYIIVENGKYMLSSALYRMWLINLSNSLENLRKQTNLQTMLNRLDRLYVLDSLTRIYNRFGFARYSGECFQECIDEKNGVMILFADLDGLKKINDRYGHDKGDLAIKTVAFALRRCCQDGEVCARFGGDEFVVYAPNYDEEKAHDFCENFERELLHYNEVLAQPFIAQASYGYAFFVPKQGDTIEQYIVEADKKMYRVKKKRHAKQERT